MSQGNQRRNRPRAANSGSLLLDNSENEQLYGILGKGCVDVREGQGRPVWQCKICTERKEFGSMSAAERHVMEQHTSFGWKCTYCGYICSRADGRHSRCTRGDQPISTRCYNRLDGREGEEALREYERFRKEEAWSRLTRLSGQLSSLKSRTGQTKERRGSAPGRGSVSRSRAWSKGMDKGPCPSPVKHISRGTEKEDQLESRSRTRSRSRSQSRSRSRSRSPILSRMMKETSQAPASNDGISCQSTYGPLSPPKEPVVEGFLKKGMRQLLVTPDDHRKRAMIDRFRTIGKSAITLDVGGKVFRTSLPSLQADPDSVFALMTDDRFGYMGEKQFFIDRDPTYFEHILNYLRNRCTTDPETLPRERSIIKKILLEAKEYNLLGFEKVLETHLKKVSFS